MKIWIASDHAGFELKSALKRAFPNWKLHDLGPSTEDRTDYPVWADALAAAMKGTADLGILICGSGQGMCMRANRYPHLRAALCWEPSVAKLARQHNDANVLCLGSRNTPIDQAIPIVEAFFGTSFEGGRHIPRVEKLSKPLKD